MLTRRTSPPLDKYIVSPQLHPCKFVVRINLHYRQDLEEVVLGEVSVGVMGVKLQSLSLAGKWRKVGQTHSPEVVDYQVENAQNDHQ